MSSSKILIIDGPLTGTGIIQITQGSTLELNGSVSSTQTIQFAASDANLILNDPSEFFGTISSFSFGNTIDLAGISFGSDSISNSNGVLSVIGSSNNLLATINFDTATSNENLKLVSDGGLGSQIIATACFLSGTLISTKNRKVPVQELVIGDKIIASDNREHIIKWIGRRTYRQPFKKNDRTIFPICICKSAFSDNIPSENLFLSPEHSILIENLLVPSKFLVNGKSIKIIDNLSEISYYHIELDNHELILAENTKVETFIDAGSRKIFENHDEFLHLYPDNRSEIRTLRFPKLEKAEDAKWIRDKLAARAGCKMSYQNNHVKPRFQGFLDDASPAHIRGWAWLPDLPNVSAELEVFVDNEFLTKITASQFRADLLNARIGNGCHGFELYFLPQLTPANHCIDVRLSGNFNSITGCPVALKRTKNETWNSSSNETDRKPKKFFGLFLDMMWPDEMRDAGSNAILDHIKIFQKMGFNIDFRATEICPKDIQNKLSKLNISVKTHDEYPTVESLLQVESSKYAFVYFHRLETVKRYAGIVQAISRDNHGRPSYKIYSVADLQFLRVLREAQAKKDNILFHQAKTLFHSEFLAIHQVDMLITHSSVEADFIRKKFPLVTPYVIPWSLKARSKIKTFSNRNGIGFLGGFDHSPNRDAIEWLLYSIMPLLWENNPEIELKIYGSGWTKSSLPKLDDRIDVVGHIENLYDALNSVRVTVAPLRFGAGLKGKVLESLAIGIPCVMTKCAAEGLCLPPKYNELIDDSPTQIASLLANLHSNKICNDTFSQIGRDMVRTFYNERAVSKLMRDALVASSPALMKACKATRQITKKTSSVTR
jgi:hypothetical protein